MQVLGWSLAIFFGRIADVTLGTIRINFIVRHKKIFAAMVGFIEVSIFIFIVSRVIGNLNNNLFGIFAYGAGFAAGTLIGMTLSDKLSHDLISINIISKSSCDVIENILRREGFGATCYIAEGMEGQVRVINVISKQPYLPKINSLVFKEDPGAFLYTQLLGTQRGGFMYGMKKK